MPTLTGRVERAGNCPTSRKHGGCNPDGERGTSAQEYAGSGLQELVVGGLMEARKQDYAGLPTGVYAWRRRAGLWRTWQNRPDLLGTVQLTDDERYWLAAFADADTSESLNIRK